MTIAEAALNTLGRTRNPSIGWGDSGLLHAVCTDAGLPHRGLRTEKLILDGLERGPTLWKKTYFRASRNRIVRNFTPTDKAKALIRERFPDWEDS